MGGRFVRRLAFIGLLVLVTASAWNAARAGAPRLPCAPAASGMAVVR
jgi:hypothetical protein